LVTVPALPVTEPAMAFVTSRSVNHPFVTLVAVAPIVVINKLAHFFKVVPKSSVSFVSETREVLIATSTKFDKAVFAPLPASAHLTPEVEAASAVKTCPSVPTPTLAGVEAALAA
jgi:hypothetical protein